MKCEHCGTEFPDDIGGSYDIQRCRAECIDKILTALRAIKPNDPEEAEAVSRQIKRFEHALEMARYVGD